ncbi:MAG: porin family protein [Bacteroidales bacterium]|nr:porin family protein [Bacteroidales bacterium]
MKRITSYLLISFLALLAGMEAHAQENRNRTLINAALHGWEYEIKAGFNIGGTSPLPLPAEIRSIDHYNPTLSVTIEGNMTKWLGERKEWGIITGLRLENKGMRTRATTKNYSMEIIGEDGNRLKGNWTGGVQTKVQNSYLTIPILAAYRASQRINVKAGPYFSYLMDGEFSGQVYDGYLRKDNPTGDRVNFNNGAIATYDFSNELRKFQWGVQVGMDWKAFKHLKIYADLNWGLNDIFVKDFNTITFAMYPIFLNVGFGYAF